MKYLIMTVLFLAPISANACEYNGCSSMEDCMAQSQYSYGKCTEYYLKVAEVYAIKEYGLKNK